MHRPSTPRAEARAPACLSSWLGMAEWRERRPSWRGSRRGGRGAPRESRLGRGGRLGAPVGTRVGHDACTTRATRVYDSDAESCTIVSDSDPEGPTRTPSRAPSCATRNTSRHATVRLGGTSRRTGGPTGCARGAASRGKRVRLGTRARARVGPSLHCGLAGTCRYPSYVWWRKRRSCHHHRLAMHSQRALRHLVRAVASLLILGYCQKPLRSAVAIALNPPT